MLARHSTIALVILSVFVAGCGGGKSVDEKAPVTAKDRIAACLKQYPESTESDCQGWEKDGMLTDDGTHKGHESMGG